MSNQTQSKSLPKPESLSAKFLLLARLPYDVRVRRKHCLTFGFIVDWYHSKYGNALASVRHIVKKLKERDPTGKGLSTRHVHDALKELTSWNYLDVIRGSGSQASRYIPNWDLVCAAPSVDPVGNAMDAAISVSPEGNSCVSALGNNTPNSVPPTGNQDPSTPTRSTDPGTGVEGIDCATTTAAALTGGADSGASQDGFEELYREYGVKKNKAAARAEYERIAPDPDQHAKMLEAARAWREAWKAQGKPDAPRMHLQKWLKDERYDEDPPSAYQMTKRKKKNANASLEPPAELEPTRKKYVGTNIVTVVNSHIDTRNDGDILTIEFRGQDQSGYARVELLPIGAQHQEIKASANKRLAEICLAAGLSAIDDSEELHGLSLIADMWEDGTVRYQSLSANDNHASTNAVIA